MLIKEIAIVDLKPYNRNPRRNDKAVDAVINSIEQFGFKIPIVVDAENVIVAGHTRYKAAQKLGLSSIPCIVADDLTPEQIKAFRLIDNKTAELAQWDMAKLGEELNSFTSEFVDAYNLNSLLNTASELPATNTSNSTSLKEKNQLESITFFFSAEQKQMIDSALSTIANEIKETFGNPNKNGNAIYEVVRQWAEQHKLME